MAFRWIHAPGGADKSVFRKMLDVRADNPLEYVHPDDVALAVCNAVTSDRAIGKILLIGGGKACQLTQTDFGDYKREMAHRFKRVRQLIFPFRCLLNPLLPVLLRRL